MSDDPRQIGETLFIDQTTRIVFEDAVGRQLVIDGEGERVHGTWLRINEPTIVPVR